jgi:3-(3-hydroxy-phenyl)propionate hydroxylase
VTTHDTQVIVAGAGPVGTVAALNLARRGINVVVCEAGPDCAQDLRASTFHPPTLEMLDELGVVDTMLEYGIHAPVYQFRERQSGEVVEFDLSEISDCTKYPLRLQCEQHVMARMLAQQLEEHPRAEMLFNHRAIAFEQTDQGVELAVETPYAIDRIRGQYIIAADGGNSILRKWLNAEFEGFTYPEKFLCLSTQVDMKEHFENLSYVNYISDPDEWLVLLKAPSVWRILLPAPESDSDEYLLSDEKSHRVFTNLTGDPNTPTEHRTIYQVHQRVAKRFDHGRVFLVGDAAHLNNPLGGFGMNSGIHDAWNLCDKLDACLSNGHDAAALELFGRQRAEVTHKFIQAQTIQNKELLEVGDAEAHALKLERMRQIQRDPEARREFLLSQAMFRSLEDAASIT